MSKIIATDHFETQNWEVTFEDLAPNYADLFIGFTDDAPVITFKDLQFGYELRQDDNIKQYGIYPPSGIRYKRSDQEYLEVVRLNTKTDESYTLFLWAENDCQKFEKEFEFAVPRPERPYPSWKWNSKEKTWKAPVPYPTDGNNYEWNQKTQSWVQTES